MPVVQRVKHGPLVPVVALACATAAVAACHPGPPRRPAGESLDRLGLLIRGHSPASNPPNELLISG
jgi:hypothetical protein